MVVALLMLGCGQVSAAPPCRPLLTIDLLALHRAEWKWESPLGQILSLPGPAHLLAEIPSGMPATATLRVEYLRGDAVRPLDASCTQFQFSAAISLHDLALGKTLTGSLDEPFVKGRFVLAKLPGSELVDLRIDGLWLGPAADRFLAGMSVVVTAPGTSAERQVELTPVSSDTSSIRAVLQTKHPASVFVGDERAEVSVIAFRTTGSRKRVDASLDLTDYFTGATEHLPVTLDFARGDSVRMEVILPRKRTGVFVVTLKIDGTPAASTRVCLLPQPAATKADVSPFGINLFQEQQQAYTFDLDLMAKAGVRWVRPWLFWENCWKTQESVRGKWDWHRLDAMLDRCDSLGMRYQYMFFGAPAWAYPGPVFWAKTTQGNALWQEYAKTLVGRYRKRISVWEHWNEPFDRFTADQFLPLARDLSTAIRAADPKAVQLGLGGVSSDFLARYTDLGGLEYCHAISTHAYYPRAPEPDLLIVLWDQHRFSLKHGHPEQHLWVNEIAHGAYDFDPTYAHTIDVSEKDQARFLVREYLISLSMGFVDKVFWFCTLDPRGIDQRMKDSGVGVLYHDYTPKLAYAALATLTHQMGSPKIIDRLDVPQPIWAYAWDVGGEVVVTAWSPRGPAGLELPVDPAKVSVVDLMGNRQHVDASSGRLALPLDESPVYIHGLQRSELRRLLLPYRVRVALDLELPAGKPVGFDVALTSVTRPGQVAVQLWAPPDVSITPVRTTMALSPGKNSVLHCTATSKTRMLVVPNVIGTASDFVELILVQQPDAGK
jgi:hypothetical protein